MMNEYICYGAYTTAFLLVIFISETLYRKWNVEPEFTRKFSHISSAVLCLSFPLFFTSHWFVFALACQSFGLLFISRNWKIFKSIDQVERTTYGSVVFPLSIYLSFFCAHYTGDSAFFYLPMLILAFSDPLAAISGQKADWVHEKFNFSIRYMKYGNGGKTYIGSLSFFISALLCSLILLSWFYRLTALELFVSAFLISVFSTFAEALTGKGLDNLSVPVTIIGTLLVLKQNY